MLLLPIGGLAMKLNDLYAQQLSWETTEKMPVLFLGHGSPMNAIEENEFVEGFKKTSESLPTPRAIVCISAHWETKGTFVTAMPFPKTIHDFGGFPKALFDVQYPAPGSPELAKEIQVLTSSAQIEMDHQWGLDHGAWSVIKHLFPNADIPVIQLSIDCSKGSEYHYQLAQSLRQLRRKGVLIIGSGNMVHNLGLVAWYKLNGPAYGYDWALEASSEMKSFLMNGNDQGLVDFRNQKKSWQLSIPTPEHFLPLIYTLGFKEESDEVSLFNDSPVAGSLTMTSVKFI
jgi:4,5-DOPA dioxygenase extradiol